MTVETARQRWSLTGIGMALVVATALVTGLVVATWTQDDAPAPMPVRASSAPADLPPLR